MTTEKEIEIIRWMKDNYPTFETNTTQIWQMARMLNDYHESEVKKLNIPAVNKSVPDWYKELSLLELQMQELKYDMPKNLIERRSCVTDLETFDMKLTAMQNVLHRAFEELKGNVV